MAGITKKVVWLYVYCRPSKKTISGSRTDMNVSMMTTATIIVISVITKMKNSNSNNNNY